MQGEFHLNPRGRTEADDQNATFDPLDEALAESFPASDPPATTGMLYVDPMQAQLREVSRREAARSRSWTRLNPASMQRVLATAQGSLGLAAGLWPMVHMRSFEAVMGPRRKQGVVKAMGLLAACAGAELLRGASRRQPSAALGAGSALAGAAFDFVSAGKQRRFRPIYLLDGFVQSAFALGWWLTRSASAPRAPLP